jgi:aminoglycoside phosphotransferase
MGAERIRLRGRNQVEGVQVDQHCRLLRKQLTGDSDDIQRRLSNLLLWDMNIDDSRVRSPHIVKKDIPENTLWYEWIDGESVQNMYERTGKLPDQKILVDIASGLARINSLQCKGDNCNLPVDSPKSSFLLFLQKEEYANLSGGEIELIALLQHDKALIEAVDNVGSKMSEDQGAIGMCHGDFRLDQVMLDDDGHVNFVDFEEFHYGNCYCDLAGLLGSLTFNSFFKVFTSTPSAPFDTNNYEKFYLEEEEKAVDELAPVLGLCIKAYEKQSGRLVDLSEISYFIAWFMVERVLSRAKFVFKISAADKAVLGLARQIIIDPETFVELTTKAK